MIVWRRRDYRETQPKIAEDVGMSYVINLSAINFLMRGITNRGIPLRCAIGNPICILIS